jgi:uncharacterized protein (TIGR04255 family)
MKARVAARIDPGEKFPHLARAPIVEAVIEVRARAGVGWERSRAEGQLKRKLPEYPNVSSPAAAHPELAPVSVPHDEQVLESRDLRFESADKRQIAQFGRDGFSFSRLHPYLDWEQFHNEALRLWKMHVELASPTDVHLLVVRFLNRIPLSAPRPRVQDLESPPKPPRGLDLPVAAFFHQETLQVPGQLYALHVRTLQPASAPDLEPGLILDIEVFTSEPFALQTDALEKRLPEMRWLKNKAFFGSLRPKALQYFKR